MTKKASEESVEVESDRVEPVGSERLVPCHVEVSKFTAPMLAYITLVFEARTSPCG